MILILAGLAISSLAGAMTALVMNLSSNSLPYLKCGILAARFAGGFAVSVCHAGVAVYRCGRHHPYELRNAFRALTLFGEETAQSLGVDVGRLRLLVIVGVALGVGGAVAVSGTIGFIGLVAP